MVNNFVWTFTTGAAPDIIPPTVILTNPLSGATNVPLNQIITATFSEAMGPGTIIPRNKFYPNLNRTLRSVCNRHGDLRSGRRYGNLHARRPSHRQYVLHGHDHHRGNQPGGHSLVSDLFLDLCDRCGHRHHPAYCAFHEPCE